MIAPAFSEAPAQNIIKQMSIALRGRRLCVAE